MRAIPVPVRVRIIRLYSEGRTTVEIAASLGYCVAAVRRVRQQYEARGTLEPQTHRCGRKSQLTETRKKRLIQLLEQRPDATLAELGAEMHRPKSTIDLWLTKLGWSPKKNDARLRAVTARRRGAKKAAAQPTGGCIGRQAGVHR
jgi:transposase